MKSRIYSKLACAFLASALIVLPCLPVHSLADPNPILIDSGKLIDNRALVPLRVVSENLGASVVWDEKLKKITLTKGDKEIVLTLHSKKVLVNQSEVVLDVPAEQWVSGLTYVPIRFVSQALGAEVQWNPQTEQATIDLEGKRLLIQMEKPAIQIPAAQKIADKRLQTLVGKLNEATDLSSIQQIRTYFSPYFTDRFINLLIANKGLEYDYSFKNTSSPAIKYTGSKSAEFSNLSDSNSEYAKNGKSLYRVTRLVFTASTWKVDSVLYSLSDDRP